MDDKCVKCIKCGCPARSYGKVRFATCHSIGNGLCDCVCVFPAAAPDDKMPERIWVTQPVEFKSLISKSGAAFENDVEYVRPEVVWDEAIKIAEAEAYERRMAYCVVDALRAAKASASQGRQEATEVQGDEEQNSSNVAIESERQLTRVVRSNDVMKSLGDLFASLRGQKLSVADLGMRVYQSLSGVREFQVADDHIGWCHYVNHGQYEDSGADILTFEACDSGAKGAFKVYAARDQSRLFSDGDMEELNRGAVAFLKRTGLDEQEAVQFAGFFDSSLKKTEAEFQATKSAEGGNDPDLSTASSGSHDPEVPAPAPSSVEAREIDVDPLRRMLILCRTAFLSLPPDALGQEPEGGWFYRDELVSNIEKTLTTAPR